MEKTIRFSISLETELSQKFDGWMKKNGYINRSEAIRHLIRDRLVEEEWTENKKEVMAVLSLVYDHHSRELQHALTEAQHEYFHLIMSATHIHLDQDNCFEAIIMKGKAGLIKQAANKLLSMKKVKHGRLTMSTTGKDIV